MPHLQKKRRRSKQFCERTTKRTKEILHSVLKIDQRMTYCKKNVPQGFKFVFFLFLLFIFLRLSFEHLIFTKKEIKCEKKKKIH